MMSAMRLTLGHRYRRRRWAMSAKVVGELLCGRVYFDDESLVYFQRSLNQNGIVEKSRQEGDTVRMFDIERICGLKG